MKGMKIKGVAKFLEKIPDYRGKRLMIIPLSALLSFLVALGLMVFLDISPRLFSSIPILGLLAPFMPIFSTLLFEILGLFLISRIWSKKEAYLEKYGERAYQKAIFFITIGIPFFVASMLHGFIPINLIPPLPEEGTITWFMANPLSIFLFEGLDPTYLPRLILGAIFVLLGLATLLRALKTFGLDYMAIIYTYYPKESTVQDNEIYSILRHPAYHAIILISIGSIFFRFSLYAMIISLLFILGMNIHVRFVEEKELKQRFGESYKKYMETTNALFYHPKSMGKYFRFLIGKQVDN